MKSFFKYLFILLIASTAAIVIAYQNDIYTWERPKQTLWISGGQLFDGTNEQAVSNPGILVENGIISCIGSQCETPRDALKIDAKGKAIVPGLIDLHGHFFGGKARDPKQSIPSMIWEQYRYLPSVRMSLIESGVTSYRSLGDVMPHIVNLKNKLADQELAGPRLFVAGPIFTVKGGHPTNKRGIPEWVLENLTVQSDDPEYVTEKVNALAKQGVDGVKVVYQSHVDEQGNITMPRMSQNTLSAIVKAAQKNNMWVAVHTGSADETSEAISTGITTIEHGVRHGNLISKELLQHIAANNIVYVPTLGREPKGHLNIPAVYQEGITLGVGTDSPVKTKNGYSFHNELERMVNAGMSHVSALLAATKNGAQALGKADEIGTIEIGKFADLLIVDGQPWQNIRELQNIDMVVIGGRIAIDKHNVF